MKRSSTRQWTLPLAAVLAVAVASCSSPAMINPQPSDNSTNKKSDGDSPEPPTPISASYLTGPLVCGVKKKATLTDNNFEAGCVLLTKDRTKKADLPTVPDSYWSVAALPADVGLVKGARIANLTADKKHFFHVVLSMNLDTMKAATAGGGTRPLTDAERQAKIDAMLRSSLMIKIPVNKVTAATHPATTTTNKSSLIASGTKLMLAAENGGTLASVSAPIGNEKANNDMFRNPTLETSFDNAKGSGNLLTGLDSSGSYNPSLDTGLKWQDSSVTPESQTLQSPSSWGEPMYSPTDSSIGSGSPSVTDPSVSGVTPTFEPMTPSVASEYGTLTPTGETASLGSQGYDASMFNPSSPTNAGALAGSTENYNNWNQNTASSLFDPNAGAAAGANTTESLFNAGTAASDASSVLSE